MITPSLLVVHMEVAHGLFPEGFADAEVEDLTEGKP